MNNTEPSNSAIKADKVENNTAAQSQVVEREFEIVVYDVSIDENTGKERITPVAFERPLTITATSKAELQSKLGLYRATGQIAKVVREINAKPIAIQPPPAQHVEQQKPQAASQQKLAQQAPIRHSAPRFFKIGDIDVKDDNGVIYQKQWVKLTEAEASNIRIVNDKSNSIVNLSGKHIEMKKWILVNRTEDDVASLEENL